jgi:tRNA (adenine57-N1/adenine58-N1)-methyltransferase
MASVFAHFVGDTGRIVTYDRREEFSNLARSNAERWGVAHRVEFKVRDMRDGFDEQNADAVFLDVQNPPHRRRFGGLLDFCPYNRV